MAKLYIYIYIFKKLIVNSTFHTIIVFCDYMNKSENDCKINVILMLSYSGKIDYIIERNTINKIDRYAQLTWLVCLAHIFLFIFLYNFNIVIIDCHRIWTLIIPSQRNIIISGYYNIILLSTRKVFKKNTLLF